MLKGARVFATHFKLRIPENEALHARKIKSRICSVICKWTCQFIWFWIWNSLTMMWWNKKIFLKFYSSDLTARSYNFSYYSRCTSTIQVEKRSISFFKKIKSLQRVHGASRKILQLPKSNTQLQMGATVHKDTKKSVNQIKWNHI